MIEQLQENLMLNTLMGTGLLIWSYNYDARFWTDTVAYIKDFYKLTNNSKILILDARKVL